MAYVLYVLSLGTGLSCPHRRADHHPHDLASASGGRDHTISPYAAATFVRHRHRVHRIPASRIVTIGRNVPLRTRRDARSKHLIWGRGQGNFRKSAGASVRHDGTTGSLRMTRMQQLPVVQFRREANRRQKQWGMSELQPAPAGSRRHCRTGHPPVAGNDRTLPTYGTKGPPNSLWAANLVIDVRSPTAIVNQALTTLR
jgi:hypothetical protein